eukprot:scaffold22576_cov129-Cylindrotheca_fusiformis.AAC.3
MSRSFYYWCKGSSDLCERSGTEASRGIVGLIEDLSLSYFLQDLPRVGRQVVTHRKHGSSSRHESSTTCVRMAVMPILLQHIVLVP